MKDNAVEDHHHRRRRCHRHHELVPSLDPQAYVGWELHPFEVLEPAFYNISGTCLIMTNISIHYQLETLSDITLLTRSPLYS